MQDKNETENKQQPDSNENKQEMVPKIEFDAIKSDLKKRLDELYDLKAKMSDIERANEAREAEEEQNKKQTLEKDGKFEELYKDAMSKYQAEQEARQADKKAAENEKLNSVAQQLASEAGAVGSDLKYVARDIRDRLTMNDGQVGVLDQSGKLTISSTKDLVSEIQSNAEYEKYLMDRQSNGGGAMGSMSGAQSKNFNELNESERVKLYNESPLKYNQAKMAVKE